MDKASPRKPNRLSFVLYDAPHAPRYYEIRKGLLKFLMYGLPLVSLISLVVVAGVGIYFKQLKLMAEKEEPAIIEKLREDNRELQKKQAELAELNNTLQEKLAQGTGVQESFGTLNLFKQAPGSRDLTTTPELAIEKMDILSLNDKTFLRFDIVNLTKEQRRISGFIFVLMKYGANITLWPTSAFAKDEMQIAFNDGELFATSRFRPVEAQFHTPQGKADVLFKILIFNRTGDLVHKQILSKQIGN